MRCFSSLTSTACSLASVLLYVAANAASFTTTNVQGSATADWTLQTIWQPGGVAPTAGNTYEALDNGTAFGSAQANTRLRNLNVAGVQTPFPGDSLTLNTNTEFRFKTAGATITFPGVAGNAGLILKGGVLNAGDDSVFTIAGKIQVASTSYIVPGDNGGGGLKPLRGFNIAAQFTGSGTMVIFQAGTNVAQDIQGTSNTFTGAWIVKNGYLKGSGSGSLGTGNITLDPNYNVGIFPTALFTNTPALLEVSYDIVSPGTLTITNGGLIILHQNCTFASVVINGTSLSKGQHPYAELAASFPNNILPGGSGSITVGLPPQRFTTTATQGSATASWDLQPIWQPGGVGPTAGNVYEALDNGTAFGNAQGNTRLRNLNTAGVQTPFPGDSLTLNTNTEFRFKTANTTITFPGVGGNAGLILKGGILNAGDDTVFTLAGNFQIASTSFIAPADNGGGTFKPLRAFKIAANLTGGGSLVIFQAATNLPQEILSVSNAYSGAWVVKAGYLKGTGAGSLGSGSITIDPGFVITNFPTIGFSNGPAVLEVSYDINSPGKLTLQNGGMMLLHQDATFDRVSIEGANLSKGSHPYSELVSKFPANFLPGGSGSITAVNGPINYTTTNTQGSATADWTLQTIWLPGNVAPTAGNTYEALDKGIAFGNSQGNTRLRNLTQTGVQTPFPGDSLTLNTNTEFRFKTAGTTITFPGVGTQPGLILRGGVLNAGDDSVFTIGGRIQIASTSYIAPADNGGGTFKPLRAFNITANLSGNGSLVIFQAATNLAQDIQSTSNSFSGTWVVKAGFLKGSGIGSLGKGSITIDPNFLISGFPTITYSNGPALLEINYDVVSPGTLTLANGGQMILHQNCYFAAAMIEGSVLNPGKHLYADLLDKFPLSFQTGGSGSITIQNPTAPPAPANLTVVNGNGQVSLSWAASATAQSYTVRRGTVSGGPYTDVATIATTSYLNTGLSNGTNYFYVVAATNPYGTSANSAQVTGQPKTGLITFNVSTRTATSINISWIGGGKLQEATDVRGPWTDVAGNPQGSFTGAFSGSAKFYRVSGP